MTRSQGRDRLERPGFGHAHTVRKKERKRRSPQQVLRRPARDTRLVPAETRGIFLFDLRKSRKYLLVCLYSSALKVQKLR